MFDKITGSSGGILLRAIGGTHLRAAAGTYLSATSGAPRAPAATNQKCFIITGEKVAFLTAFLNSSLFKYCFRDSFPELQGGTRELSKIFFDLIPVIKVTQEINEKFKEAIMDIQASYTKDKALAIDKMIFELYHLDDDLIQGIGYIEIS